MRAPGKILIKIGFAACGVAALVGSAFAEPDATEPDSAGIYEDYILFGQSAALSGPAGELGKNMQTGILAAFKEVNDRGGINGRRLELRSLDDAYEPEAAVANTKQLIDENVLALIGAVGTPNSRSVLPVVEAHGVPYIAPMTGAEFLRDDTLQTVINLRASYNQETEEMVERLTTDLGITRIAILYQDDSFGRAGYEGVLQALKRRKLSLIGSGVFSRNTIAVKTALIDLLEVKPEAVIVVGPYRPTAAFVKWAQHLGMQSVFMTLSFVGSNALARELGPDGNGVFVTQVVPFPTGNTPQVAVWYRAALRAFDPAAKPGFISFEGYLAGRLAIQLVRHCGKQPSRTCIDLMLRSGIDINIGGFTLNYGINDNQGSDKVFITVITPDGHYAPITTLNAATN